MSSAEFAQTTFWNSFLFSSKNKLWHFMPIVFEVFILFFPRRRPVETACTNCQSQLSGKNKKIPLVFLPAEFTRRVGKVTPRPPYLFSGILIRIFIVHMKKLSIFGYLKMSPGKILIRLRESAVWSESSLGALDRRYASSCAQKEQ